MSDSRYPYKNPLFSKELSIYETIVFKINLKVKILRLISEYIFFDYLSATQNSPRIPSTTPSIKV